MSSKTLTVEEHSEKIAKRISKRTGLKVEPMSKHRFPKLPLALSRDGNKIQIRIPPKRDVEIRTSTKFKQFTLSATEDGREFQQEVSWTVYNRKRDRLKFNAERHGRSRIAVADATITFVEGSAEWKELSHSKKGSRAYTCTAMVDVKVPANETFILAGKDEKANFICLLPRKPKSVNDAHVSLRPKGVTAKTKRQGEFFFVPVTKAELKSIRKMELGKDSDRTQEEYRGEQVYNYGMGNEGTNHRASLIAVLKGDDHRKNYDACLGQVWHEAGEHDPVFLDTWHKAVPNMALDQSQIVDPYQAAWD